MRSMRCRTVEGAFLPALGRGLEDELRLAHAQHGVQRHLHLEDARGAQVGAIGGVEVHHVEEVLLASHLQVAAGDEAILDDDGVGGILADGEALAAELVEELGAALLHAQLGGLELLLSLGRLPLHARASADAGGALGLGAAALPEHRAPPAQGDVRAVWQLALLQLLAGDNGALAGEILELARLSVVGERHLLAADVGVGNDDIAALTTAEHHTLLAEREPEHFLATTKEHQLRHSSLQEGRRGFIRCVIPLAI
jgi:hypothetical protein